LGNNSLKLGKKTAPRLESDSGHENWIRQFKLYYSGRESASGAAAAGRSMKFGDDLRGELRK